jgi:hypothetical protein
MLLKQDHGFCLSENTVERILKNLMIKRTPDQRSAEVLRFWVLSVSKHSWRQDGWAVSRRLKKVGLIDRLFGLFDRLCGREASHGVSVDVIILSRCPVNAWQKRTLTLRPMTSSPPPGRRPEDPVKLAQRDRDARWIVKYSKAKGDKRALAYLLNKNNTSCSV